MFSYTNIKNPILRLRMTTTLKLQRTYLVRRRLSHHLNLTNFFSLVFWFLRFHLQFIFVSIYSNIDDCMKGFEYENTSRPPTSNEPQFFFISVKIITNDSKVITPNK